MGATKPSCGDDLSYLEHQGVVADRPLARCYRIGGIKVWLQKRLIRDSNDKIVVIPTWLAKSKKMSSDY